MFFCFNTEANNKIFKHIQISNGLSQTSVTCLLQDTEGSVWMGTRDGLNVYNGRNMTTFVTNNHNDSTSISGNLITDIQEDNLGNIWVSTNSGLSYYNKNKGTFKNYTINNPNGLEGNIILKLYVDCDQKLWVGMNDGLYLFDKNTFRKIETLNIFSIKAIYQDNEGRFWLGTMEKGLLLYNPRTDSFISFQHIPNNPASISNNNVTNIYEDSKTNLWISTKKGLNLMDRSTGSFKVFLHDKNNPNSLINNSIRVVKEDTRGQLWIGTYKGISIFDYNTKEFSNISMDENYSLGLTHNSIYDIICDQRGSVWIATYFGGVNIYDSYLNQVSFYEENNFDTSLGLSFRVVGPIVEDNQHRIWIGTEGKGINLFNPITKKFTQLNYKSIGLPSDSENIKALFWSKDNKLWIGTNSSGIIVYNPKTKKHKRLTKGEGSLTSNTISGIVEKDAKMYISTNAGVNVYDLKTKEFFAVQLHGKSNVRVRELIIDRKGILWFATENLGVFAYNNKSGIIDHYRHIDGDENSLSSNFTSALFESLQGEIWVGTRGGGLNRFNQQTKKFEHFNIEDGLSTNTINGILEGNTGALWVSTLKGLSRFNQSTNRFKSYSSEDILPNSELNEHSVFKSKNGTFYVGTTQGLMVLNENTIKENPYMSPINFTELKVGNHVVRVGDESGILKKPIYETKEINLPHDYHSLSIFFSDFNFINTKSSIFGAYLEGFDDEWRTIGSVNNVTYTSLKPGKYTLHVRVGKKGGVWSDNIKSLTIVVNQSPFATWWAYAVYLGIILTIIYLLWIYTLKMEKMKHGLELADVERSKLEEVNQLKLKFFTNISHEFRTPLTLIMTPIRELLDSKSGNRETKEKYEIVYKNANRLYQLINELMDFRKQETGNLQLKVKKHNLYNFLHDAYFSFKDHARQKEIDYTFECDKDAELFFDKMQFEKVIINLLSNAFKFTPTKGRIDLSCFNDAETDLMCIKITDSGKGIPADLQQTIFDRFYQIENAREDNEVGTGIGLALSKGIVDLHGGEISVESIEGHGTTFTILLPEGATHYVEEQLVTDEAVEEVVNDEMPEQEETEGLKILVVEDNEDMRSLVASVFKDSCTVLEAEDGEQGLAMAIENMPDLIISDIMMPKVSGIDLCRRLKQNLKTSHIPIILLTAKHSDDTKIAGIDAGADGFVTKPFNANMLKVRCRNLIKSRAMLRKKFSYAEEENQSEATGLNSLDEKLIRDAKQAIEKHVQDPEFNVNMLAHEIGLGRTMLYTKIKAISGQTPNGFIQTYRLQKAAEMLMKDPTLNVSEVCYSVGFNTPKYFSKCFFEQFGEKPSVYAKKLKEKAVTVVE